MEPQEGEWELGLCRHSLPWRQLLSHKALSGWWVPNSWPPPQSLIKVGVRMVLPCEDHGGVVSSQASAWPLGEAFRLGPSMHMSWR